MLQRIKNVFHKPIEMSHNIYESSDEKLRLEKDNRLAIKNGQAVHLTQLEMDLLECFLTNQNKLLSRDEILSKVWKLEADGVYIDSRTVDVHVKNLRRKLNLKSIHSIRGVGYRWHEE